MSIVKRKNGTYDVEVYVNSKRVATKRGFATKTKAMQWHEERRSNYRADPDRAVRVKVPDRTFDELLEAYMKHHLPTVKETTEMRYLVDINERIRERFKFCKLKDISHEVVLKLQTELLDSLSQKSINNCIALLKSIFTFGINLKMLRENPCTQIKPFKTLVRDYSWWKNWDDVQTFLQATTSDRKGPPHYRGGRDPYAAGYRLGVECGMRLGEIVGLSKSDVDLERCAIHIHRQWVVKKMDYDAPKHNKVRTIGFDPDSDLRELLKDAIEASPHPEMIFVDDDGKRVRNDKLAGRYFQNWITLLGLPRIAFHDTRHTFASWFMIRGGDIWELMELLGHSNVKTTMRYAHLSPKVKRVPSMNGGNGPDNDDDVTAKKITSSSRQKRPISLVRQ